VGNVNSLEFTVVIVLIHHFCREGGVVLPIEVKRVFVSQL
jgi:hypothetical protein